MQSFDHKNRKERKCIPVCTSTVIFVSLHGLLSERMIQLNPPTPCVYNNVDVITCKKKRRRKECKMTGPFLAPYTREIREGKKWGQSSFHTFSHFEIYNIYLCMI